MRKNILKFLGYLFYKGDRFSNLCKSTYLSNKISRGGGVRIGGSVTIAHSENIFIGKNTFMNGGELTAGNNSKIVIGENVLISYNVHIRTVTHRYGDKSIPIIEQGGIEKDIIIGNNVWIGYGTQIMSGVTIGDGAVIGAGAIVTKDVGKDEVWGGVPAHFIKNR